MRFLSAHTEIYSQMASGGLLISNPAYISSVFTKKTSVHKPTEPVNHENPQAQILFCWPEKKRVIFQIWGWASVCYSSFIIFYYFKQHYLSL